MTRNSRIGGTQVRVLTGWDESRALESVSITRFRALSSRQLAWQDGSYLERLSFQDEADCARQLSSLLSRLTRPDAELAVFWDTLVMPTVVLPAKLAREHMDEIVQATGSLWMFMPNERLFIECLPEGQITVAEVPDGNPAR